MNTGWRAASDSRRPHKSQELRKSGGKSTISKRRRQSVKDSNSALRLRGQLTEGKSDELLRREQESERQKARVHQRPLIRGPGPSPDSTQNGPTGPFSRIKPPERSISSPGGLKPPQNGSQPEARTTKCPTGTERRHRHDHQRTPPHSPPGHDPREDQPFIRRLFEVNYTCSLCGQNHMA